MRTEKEMMDIILNTAKNDERIRAVLMTGSCVNPNAKKDIFQDYDIAYIVKDIESFTENHHWVDRFGERIMMQMPEDKVLPHADHTGHFVYLMQFTDGNRIDLTLIPLEKMNELVKPESLRIVLLDKDGLIGQLPPSSDLDFYIKIPSEKEFQDICNEFWWICMNIAKGLWREELPYSMVMYEQINRNVLIQMINWYIGIQTNYSKSTGAFGKYLENFLEKDEWNEFVATYTDAHYEHIWIALFHMCELFRKIAVKVAHHFQFDYKNDEDHNVTAYLERIRNLPKDTKEI
ncbi:aminoglycoside 6-adenylyltransferase [Neobacillus drentensis]|uniref:aminoglycoside 6-adenylyltransferase n=1 Tax=Neobacillus drentensis TaxID=220684 RepID=UPI0030005984